MKKLLALAAAASVAIIAAPAFADSNVSIGYSNSNISSFNIGAVTARAGWNSGPFGIEGEGSFGLQSDSNGTGAGRESAKLSSEFGVFGTAQADVSKDFELFARAGYATADYKSTHGVSPTATNSSNSSSGFAYGAGAQWNFDAMDGVRVDYTIYNFNVGKHPATTAPVTPAYGGADADVWSVSYVRKFK